MSPPIVTEALTKYYGSTRGIEGVDLEVEQGEVFGFLGPNGAGKSTTIRTLLDFIRPTRGSARLLGMDSREDSIEIHRRVGYLPGELVMYDKMTAREMLNYFAALRSMPDLSPIERLAERFDIDLDRKIRAYSSGSRQKIGLIQAFMHRPELLILDEPTSGLDPIVQQEFYSLINEVSDEGRTVFLSSHVLPEVERITDRAAIIRRGRLVTVADIETLKARARRSLELTFASPVPPEEFSALETVHSVEHHNQGHTLVVVVEGAVDPVIKVAARHQVTNIVSHQGDLESAFLAFYRGDDDAT